MHQGKLLGAALIALSVIFVTSGLYAQEEVIEKRQKLMKSNSAAAKAIKNAAEKKDYATLELKAKDIADNMDKVADLFPKGSTSEKSRAKAEIWEKWDDFGKNAGKVKKAAGELAEAGKAKDDAAVGTKVKALGDACGACHKAFRAEEKKKSGG